MTVRGGLWDRLKGACVASGSAACHVFSTLHRLVSLVHLASFNLSLLDPFPCWFFRSLQGHIVLDEARDGVEELPAVLRRLRRGCAGGTAVAAAREALGQSPQTVQADEVLLDGLVVLHGGAQRPERLRSRARLSLGVQREVLGKVARARGAGADTPLSPAFRFLPSRSSLGNPAPHPPHSPFGPLPPRSRRGARPPLRCRLPAQSTWSTRSLRFPSASCTPGGVDVIMSLDRVDLS